MKGHKQLIIAAALFAGAVGLYMAWAAYRAHSNLVTLDVRNMDIRQVVAKIRRQTWEDIQVDKNVQGKVSLRVRKVPLDEVLRAIGEQTSSRPLVLYPLYSSSASLTKLKQAVRGEIDGANNGWTNLAAGLRGGFGPGGAGPGPGPRMVAFGAGPFGAMPDNSKQLVSLTIHSKELSFAVQAFGRFAQARVVPEDGTRGIVTLAVSKTPVGKAVAQLARKAGRKSAKIYVLRGGFAGPRGGGPQLVMRGENERGSRGFGGSGGPDELTEEQREEMRQQREILEQELRQALPPEERKAMEAQQAEREQQMREFASLTPEQRRDQMAQMRGNAQFDRMNRSRVLNSTPEQRAEMTRRQRDMRQRGDQGGPPRGPGR